MESPNDVLMTIMLIFSIVFTGGLVVGFLWMAHMGSK